MAKLAGKWTLKAIGNDAGWQQRIVINGSNAHDGPHVMILGDTIPHVEGNDINIIAQAFNPGTSAWIDSLVQEVMNWDNASGLQVDSTSMTIHLSVTLISMTWSFSAQQKMPSYLPHLPAHDQT